MGWLGKVVGGTIGFAIGGPIGAVAGAAFGHTLDKKEERYLSSNTIGPGLGAGRLSNNEEAQLTFFIAAFSMLAKITKADGRISEIEISSVEDFMKKDLNLDNESQATARNIFREAVNSQEQFDAFAMQFYSVFRTQPRLIELMMDVLLRVSAADGKISPEEEILLLSAARIFNISDSAYSNYKKRYIKETNKYYALLNCDENATDQEIKKQYRKLATEYHPDKIQAKGLPEEFVKFANDNFIKIQEAYDYIKKERGL
ncbi:MAG: TerB family tellurite resistance protein [Desulfobacteraceae bacterium]|nr:TerB family tellurite resistance protein [Desulfobacteraceae bacterium]